MVEMTLTTCVQDQDVYQVPLEIVSDILSQVSKRKIERDPQPTLLIPYFYYHAPIIHPSRIPLTPSLPILPLSLKHYMYRYDIQNTHSIPSRAHASSHHR